ncbi:DNA sulfur modification protein DndD [Burkholderia stagnalis]|uniref:DNA sulfur modification protein DndD n=1 Tax=Burkholderia stagnalis TaxID=1503054 RepID=UPI00075FCCC6|nr:DNA sulfur modification protein DndD [Burkholderia stagnalis]KWK22001.1 DNA sulfur modification protein DndD [Burkholderia stagnalis]
MAKVTITSLSIENLGPFLGSQSLDFSVSGAKPVILVKALNGSGKTTLLTALQIGLYGQKALGDVRRSEYEQLLNGLRRRDATGNPAIEVSLLLETSGFRRHLSVRREWSVEENGIQERLAVFEDGSKDLDFTETWGDFIGTILPAELVQLFLFDGEKIEALANPERLPDLLKRATEVFLGIGGIDALGSDLKALERRAALRNKTTSTEFATARENVATWLKQAEELEARLEHLIQDQAAARNVAEQAQVALDKFSAGARRRGLTAYEKATDIRDRVVATRRASEDARANLADAVSDPVLPALWLSEQWTSYCNAWEQDQSTKHSKLLSREFRKRDKRILDAFRATAAKSSLEALRGILEEDLKALNPGHAAGTVVMQEAAPEQVKRQLLAGQSRLRQAFERLRSTQSDLDRAEQQIGQIPAEEQLSEILQSLQSLSKAASDAEACLSNTTREVEDVRGQLDHARMRLNAAQDRLSTEFRGRSLETKGLEASVRARRALTIFKDRLLASKAEWLSSTITAEFRKLLRKRNLVAAVVVDPGTYEVSIIDNKQQELPMERLSAGERQLLAIAVLSALIKERKGRFPVVVDTPLARLDQQHRSTLIKQFFATVSHQVVVLSTDQEVEGPAYETLIPFTNVEYSLNFNDQIGCTEINRVATTKRAI